MNPQIALTRESTQEEEERRKLELNMLCQIARVIFFLFFLLL